LVSKNSNLLVRSSAIADPIGGTMLRMQIVRRQNQMDVERRTRGSCRTDRPGNIMQGTELGGRGFWSANSPKPMEYRSSIAEMKPGCKYTLPNSDGRNVTGIERVATSLRSQPLFL